MPPCPSISTRIFSTAASISSVSASTKYEPASGSTVFAEVGVRVEEERQPWSERVDLHAAPKAFFDVGDAARERVRHLFGGGGAGVAVMRGDRDRVEARQPLDAVLDDVGAQPHRRPN